MVSNWLHASRLTLHLNRNVERIELSGSRWQAIDAQGLPIAAADVVVLANGDDAVRLAGTRTLPLQRLRGQTTRLAAATPGLVVPRVPVTGRGYALTLPNGDLLCGASSSADDNYPGLREGEHRRNLEQLARLTDAVIDVDAAGLAGGVGWRVTSPDRLPVLGPVPAPDASGNSRIDQPRRVPRRPGVYIATGFGSRGITQAALAGEVVAAWITGAPIPVAADLLDAVDVARFAARAARVA
jgi:tRNA 5-methylaminomethyl-2-thiouridine biosynthesis bifunctional protein